MTKKDLKSGMVVRTLLDTDGENLGLVVDTEIGFLIQFNNYWQPLCDYNDDLTNNNQQYNDIVEIKQIKYGHQVIRKDLRDAKTIWERNKPKEYTMQEIADKLGINVEDLKIKK